jgi:hypothetical protein
VRKRGAAWPAADDDEVVVIQIRLRQRAPVPLDTAHKQTPRSLMLPGQIGRGGQVAP